MPLKDFLETLNILEPEDVKIELDETRNALKLDVRGETHTEVVPVRPFPISFPRFVIFGDAQGSDICMIKDSNKLDPKSRESLEKLLNKIFFIPKIVEIERLEASGDKFEWETVTDRGRRKFSTRGRRSIILMGNRIVITDIDDNVYEIQNLRKLDRKSRAAIESTF